MEIRHAISDYMHRLVLFSRTAQLSTSKS